MFKPFLVLLALPRYFMQALLLAYLVVALPLRALYYQIRLIGVPASPRDPQSDEFDVICFSHVPWSHIWQRNHHTMTRLAQNRKVVYFQTTSIAYIHWFIRHWPHALTEYKSTFPGITLVYPLMYPGQSKLPLVGALNRWFVVTQMRWIEHRLGLKNVVLWFYYPACVDVLDSYKPVATVYDIQDEYTAFNWSPPDIARREQKLIERADIIFAGTHALYESKTANFKGVAHFYPCAVEFSHFYAAAPAFSDEFFAAHPEITADDAARIRAIVTAFHDSGETYGTVSLQHNATAPALDGTPAIAGGPVGVSPELLKSAGRSATVAEAEDIRNLRRPRLVYVGLIDKRIDPDLLAYLGQSHPEWEIVMVGPVDERLFDHYSVMQAAPNVHFVGSAKYHLLPTYLAYCDVYLMPWKVNDLTRHINPTKTLEYMAAARPVVSISLPDLENLFSDSVNLATTPEEFVRECEAALAGQRWHKVAVGLERAWSFAWNTVVNEMEGHVKGVIGGKKP